jgi:hypothetical protein
LCITYSYTDTNPYWYKYTNSYTDINYSVCSTV